MNKTLRNLLFILGGLVAFRWMTTGKNPFVKTKSNAQNERDNVVSH